LKNIPVFQQKIKVNIELQIISTGHAVSHKILHKVPCKERETATNRYLEVSVDLPVGVISSLG
jgi:hypothetical protein